MTTLVGAGIRKVTSSCARALGPLPSTRNKATTNANRYFTVRSSGERIFLFAKPGVSYIFPALDTTSRSFREREASCPQNACLSRASESVAKPDRKHRPQAVIELLRRIVVVLRLLRRNIALYRWVGAG